MRKKHPLAIGEQILETLEKQGIDPAIISAFALRAASRGCYVLS